MPNFWCLIPNQVELQEHFYGCFHRPLAWLLTTKLSYTQLFKWGHSSLFIYFLFSATKELHSPDGDSTTAPPSQSSEQSEVKNKVDFVLNPLQITSCSDVGSPPQTPSVKKIKKVCYFSHYFLLLTKKAR